MKRTIALLAVALLFLIAAVSPVSAVITPRDFPDGPGDGSGNGDDGDHPWGGDRVIGGGGSTNPRDVRTSALTGYLPIDIFISSVIIYLAPQEHQRDELKGSLYYSARAKNRFSLSREANR